TNVNVYWDGKSDHRRSLRQRLRKQSNIMWKHSIDRMDFFSSIRRRIRRKRLPSSATRRLTRPPKLCRMPFFREEFHALCNVAVSGCVFGGGARNGAK